MFVIMIALIHNGVLHRHIRSRHIASIPVCVWDTWNQIPQRVQVSGASLRFRPSTACVKSQSVTDTPVRKLDISPFCYMKANIFDGHTRGERRGEAGRGVYRTRRREAIVHRILCHSTGSHTLTYLLRHTSRQTHEQTNIWHNFEKLCQH